MDFLSMELVTIPCSELIPCNHKLKKQGLHNISIDKLLGISCKHTDFTSLYLPLKNLMLSKLLIFLRNRSNPLLGFLMRLLQIKVFFLCQQYCKMGQIQLELGIKPPLHITYKLMEPLRERTRLLFLCLLIRSCMIVQIGYR